MQTTSDPAYPSDHAAVAGASAAVLSYLYPNETAWLAKQAAADDESRLEAGVNFRSDITAGNAIGLAVAQDVVKYAKNDGSNIPWNGTVPTGPGKWVSTTSPATLPLLPNWGNVTPWLFNSSNLVMPPAPPAFGSAQFEAALKEVKQIANNRTEEQLQIAQLWDDGAGTSTPTGHWNAIACGLIQNDSMNELRAARTLALMNIATEDAGICCFKAKYRVLVSQAHYGRSDYQYGLRHSELSLIHLWSLRLFRRGGRSLELHLPEGTEPVTRLGATSVPVSPLRRYPLPI